MQDFSIGYGSEIEEGGWSFVNVAGLVILALVLVVYLVRRRKAGKKR